MSKEPSCCYQGNNNSCKGQNGQCEKIGGCAGGCCSSGCQNRVIYINEDESAFLLKLAQIPFLPLARFISSDLQQNTILKEMAPVYLEDKNDGIETVAATGEILQSLSNKHLITLDYDLPLKNGDYSMYEESEAYRRFRQNDIAFGTTTVSPTIQYGSIALTSLGQDALDNLE